MTPHTTENFIWRAHIIPSGKAMNTIGEVTRAKTGNRVKNVSAKLPCTAMPVRKLTTHPAERTKAAITQAPIPI